MCHFARHCSAAAVRHITATDRVSGREMHGLLYTSRCYYLGLLGEMSPCNLFSSASVVRRSQIASAAVRQGAVTFHTLNLSYTRRFIALELGTIRSGVNVRIRCQC